MQRANLSRLRKVDASPSPTGPCQLGLCGVFIACRSYNRRSALLQCRCRPMLAISPCGRNVRDRGRVHEPLLPAPSRQSARAYLSKKADEWIDASASRAQAAMQIQKVTSDHAGRRKRKGESETSSGDTCPPRPDQRSVLHPGLARHHAFSPSAIRPAHRDAQPAATATRPSSI
jgi:hypothetical protein